MHLNLPLSSFLFITSIDLYVFDLYIEFLPFSNIKALNQFWSQCCIVTEIFVLRKVLSTFFFSQNIHFLCWLTDFLLIICNTNNTHLVQRINLNWSNHIYIYIKVSQELSFNISFYETSDGNKYRKSSLYSDELKIFLITWHLSAHSLTVSIASVSSCTHINIS